MRLIDADALRANLPRVDMDLHIMDIKRRIDRAPTVDAVPVERCEECSNKEKARARTGCKYCTREKDIQIKFEGEEAGRAWMHNCSDGYGLFLEGEVITYIDVKYCPMCGRKLEVQDDGA